MSVLDIISSLFNAIVSGVQTIIQVIVSIPTYITTFISWVGLFPSFITMFLFPCITVIVVICIKRLVI